MSVENNNLKSNLIQICELLIDPKLVRISVIINLITFIPGLIICVFIANYFGPQGYNIWDNFISDLRSFLLLQSHLFLTLY